MTKKLKDTLPDRPVRFEAGGKMPQYWPPKPNPLWRFLFKYLDRYYARKYWQITDVEIVGDRSMLEQFKPEDGILIAPNHSHEADAHVMLELGYRTSRQMYFMAAWQAFHKRGKLVGWLFQRMGCFSVDRDGSDRRAIKEAIGLLTSGNPLVIFPEGEIHRLNERLQPILEGVAFMALSSQQKLLQSKSTGHVWIVPCVIQYKFVDDVTVQLEQAMQRLEKHLVWFTPPAQASLEERIYCFGETLLTLKEKEKFGSAFDDIKDLSQRIQHDIDLILKQRETEFLGKTSSNDEIPMRVKALRRKLLKLTDDDSLSASEQDNVYRALDDVQFALQLFSYPGDYIKEGPSAERMAETIERFQEDVFGVVKYIGRRKARLVFAPPMDMHPWTTKDKKPTAVADITHQLETSIKKLMNT